MHDTAAPAARPGIGPRLRRFAWLVVLSWALAGSFYLLDRVALLFMGVSQDSAWLAGLQTRGRDLSPQPSRRPPSVSPEAWAESKLAAFALGRAFGVASAVADSGGDERLTAQAARLMDRPAETLGISAPALFRPRHTAQFLAEFDAHLESDAPGMLRVLRERYSPGHGELFRLGASLEVQEYYARGLGQWAPANRIEIRKYGLRSGLPEDLWGPFTRDVSKPLSTDERARLREDMLKAIQNRIAEEPTQQ